MLRIFARAVVVSVLVVLVAAPSALAAFPGANGKIAFATMRDEPDPTGCGARGGCNSEIYSINADGTGLTRLTNDPAFDFAPAWSPDGRQIAFTRNGRIYKMNADGSGVTSLSDGTAQGGFGVRLAWSPDGTKMAFERDGLWTMNADGSGQTQIGPTGSTKTGPREPAWSPDGRQIAFSYGPEFGPRDIYTINPDGTGQTKLTNVDISEFPQFAVFPDWSPDATRIAFVTNKDQSGAFDPYDLYTINRDGSGEVRVTIGSENESAPAWSPNGTKIAFEKGGSSSFDNADIYIVNPDGTGQVNITNSPAYDSDPNWQPVPVNYPRPAGATPLRVSLVVGFAECTAPNKVHGPPLEHPSCGDNFNPHHGNSDHVTVGTPDFNGAPAKFIGSLRIAVQVGNPATPADEADLRLTVSTTDIRCRPVAAPVTCGTSDVVGADYAGELQPRVALRITDKNNMPAPNGPGAATTIEMPYSFTVPCTETPDDDMIGSACQVDTTADALVPGTIKEGARAIWELRQVEVLDGGPDGDVDTPAGAMVFLRQGIFIP